MLIVGEIFHTVLNADVLTGQQMPDQSKHNKGGDGFKEIFDKELDQIKKEGDGGESNADATSKDGSSADRIYKPGRILP